MSSSYHDQAQGRFRSVCSDCSSYVLSPTWGTVDTCTTHVSTCTHTPPNPAHHRSSLFAPQVLFCHSNIAEHIVWSRILMGMGKSSVSWQRGDRDRRLSWLWGCFVHCCGMRRRKAVRVSSSHPVYAIQHGLTSTTPLIRPEGPSVVPLSVKMHTAAPMQRFCLVGGGWY